ncbi:Putative uncharacterized protein [Taphrina deformans PYCC 5710]|uniref:Zinc finger C2H2 LYAR-type domain-containing protein n=1 Tax=Taphrina deformans (strain PYCC 5710 / ATCC 11124 / CBS 356.35 / IMI 108563 / JCM 9778 / NBRC 8474) TaxID=1097556 RepID=R4X9E7_TAPDE|nr:Putative uncharacterized protein [Taphrina deformans PYCC 5710]|eukprot:CCG80834.1 Putative uncharacterized protein [Taphrina deformans PYCC 5710]
MVTFSCDSCNDTVKKPKANQHAQRCRAGLTCIDCSKTFYSGDWSVHNSCISEAEAYQGALYKPTKKELKRKNMEKAAELAGATKLVTESPASSVVAPLEAVLPKDSIIVSESSSKKQKKEKSAGVPAEAKSPGGVDVSLLKAVIPDGQTISIHKALKLLKAQNKLDKESEKTLLKTVQLSKASDGTIVLS